MTRVLPVAVVVALVAGCAVAPLKPTTEVGPDQGVVVLRVTTNAAPVGFFSSYHSAHVVSDSGIYTLARRTPGAVRTGVFTGALPPGRYRLTRLESIGQNVRRWIEVPTIFGTFTVQAGQLTDLGTVVYQPAGGGKFLFARTSSEAETRELVAAAFPKVADAVLGRPILGWDPNADADRLAKVFAAMRASAAPVNAPLVAPSGALYAGSVLGQVLARRAGETTWTQLGTGTTREILSVVEDGGGAIVAGGEEGFLARSTDGGRSWQRMRAPDGGAVLHLVRRTNAGLLVTSLFERSVTVWEQTGETWQARHQFPFERSFNVIGDLPPYVVSTPTRLYVGMPNGAVHGFDFASGQWQRHEASFSLIALATAGEALYAYGGRLTHSIWRSEDGGKTWQDLDTSRRAGAPVFSDPRTGYVLYIKEIYGGKMTVQQTKDAGRTWTETGELPASATRRVIVMRPMVVHPAGPTLFVFATNGAVYSTRDLGATWTEERRGTF